MSSLSSAAAPVRPAGPPLRVSHLGDELLARQAARGSERAFTALYERYHQQLYRYCRSILRNDTDSQDALQSTFTGALQALRRGQRNAPLRPWLYRIAHNESISLLRRRSRSATEELSPESMGMGASVEQEAADRARWQGLVADLAGLPDRQRGALLLRELSGLSHEEIAVALGTSAAGAKQAIFEARQALAELEEGRGMSCEEVRKRVSEGDRRMLRGRRVNAHLHACAACEAFALAIPQRRAQLRAFAPVLAPGAAAAVFSRSVHAASAAPGAGSGGASAAAGAGFAGKAVGAAALWKGLAAVALIVTAAAGAVGVRQLLASSSATGARTVLSAPAGRSGAGRVNASRAGMHRPFAPPQYARRATHGAADRGITASRTGAHQVDAATVSGVTDAGSGAKPGQGAAGGAATTSNSGGQSGSAPLQSVSSPTGSSGQPVGSHGHSGSAPGHTGNNPGRSGTSPGRAGTTPGQGGSSPGQTGTSPGQAGNTPGQSGSAPGQSSGGSGGGGGGGSGGGGGQGGGSGSGH